MVIRASIHVVIPFTAFLIAREPIVRTNLVAHDCFIMFLLKYLEAPFNAGLHF
jgi:hypothetical protein